MIKKPGQQIWHKDLILLCKIKIKVKMQKYLNLSKRPILAWMMKFFMKYQLKKNDFIHNLEYVLIIINIYIFLYDYFYYK